MKKCYRNIFKMGKREWWREDYTNASILHIGRWNWEFQVWPMKVDPIFWYSYDNILVTVLFLGGEYDIKTRDSQCTHGILSMKS